MSEKTENNKLDSQNVNIETIMQEVRQEILARKLPGGLNPPLQGKRFAPAFYEQLYQASLVQSQLGVKVYITKSPLPLVGGLIDWLRSKFHQLVIFYINQLAEQQADINNHLLQAISLMAQELEEDA